MLFKLKISSKDKTILNNFLTFLSKLQFPFKIASNLSTFQKKKFVTVLKSPHVNKDAQEQFEFRIFSKELLIRSAQSKLLILILKKAVTTSFSGIKIQVYALSNSNNSTELLLNSLNPSFIDLNFFELRAKNRTIAAKKVNQYLNLSDCYGEILTKTGFLSTK